MTSQQAGAINVVPAATLENGHEGWALRLERQRCQIIAIDARFSSDEEALNFVRDAAAAGSEIHAYVLEMTKP